MLVYKYRGGDDKIFERDLNSLEKNYFWSSNFKDLNDPFETIIDSDKFVKQSNSLKWLLGKKRLNNIIEIDEALKSLIAYNNKIGIYSLSTTNIDELLWAHYANSHKGFCVEYDLDLLIDNHVKERKRKFSVVYSSVAPEIKFNDIINLKNEDLIRKMFGYKSKKWKYEDEYRIVTENFGAYNYDYKAVKSIYFGLRMDEKQKKDIIQRLSGRGIKYYQIIQLEKKYELKAILLEDINDSEITYLKKIPENIIGKENVNYNILEKFYIKFSKKAEIKIELEIKVSDDLLEKLSIMFTNHLFQGAERIYLFFYLKGEENFGIPWKAVNIINDKISVSTLS